MTTGSSNGKPVSTALANSAYVGVDANGIFQTASTPSSSGLILVQSQTASNSTNLDFINLTSNLSGNYLLYINGYRPATDATQLLLTVSTNNGSSFESTNYFSGLNYSAYNTGTLTNANSTSNMIIGAAISQAASFHACVWISNISSAQLGIHGTASWAVSGSGNNGRFGATWQTGTVNAIRLASSSGNMTIGGFSLYRLVTS